MKIITLLPIQEKHKAMLEAISPENTFIYTNRNDVSQEDLNTADIIVGNPDVTKITDADNLKLIQLNSAGTDEYIKNPTLMPKNAVLCNASGAYGKAISEHLLAMLLTILKRINLYIDNQTTATWKSEGMVRSISELKVLTVGLGDIGEQFAKKMNLMGAYNIGIKRTPSEKPEFIDELYTMEKLDELLPQVDVVALSLPGTPETFHLFDEKKLALMKDDAILLNVGRGNAIDSEALCKVLDSGKLFGVGLDVTEPEPLPADSKLWKYRNVVITPHVSGGFHMQATHDTIIKIAHDNIVATMNGESLKNVVDFGTGYRVKENKF